MIVTWRVLVTGATGRVAFPIARELAREHEVFGMARCTKPGDEAKLRAAGIEPIVADVSTFDLAALPAGPHARVPRGRRARRGGARRLAAHLRRQRGPAAGSSPRAAACGASCTARPGRSTSTRARGRCARTIRPACTSACTACRRSRARRSCASPPSSTASPRRSSASSRRTARSAARRPTGSTACSPGKAIRLHPDAPNRYNPIYEDDYVAPRHPRARGRARPAAHGELGRQRDGERRGLPRVPGRASPASSRASSTTPTAPWPIWPDVTRMHEVLGRTEVPWRDGMRRMLEARHPEFARPVSDVATAG